MITTGFIQANSSSLKDLHRQLKAIFRISAMRAALHTENSTSHPLPSNTSSLEHIL